MVLACIFALMFAHDAPSNLAANPSFELLDAAGLPEGWSGWNDVWQPDAKVHASGERCARYRNMDASRYVLLSQRIHARAGKRYRFSARIKTEGIEGPDTGATICMEWSDQSGRYLGGSYPEGVKGTLDWTTVGDMTPRVPQNAAVVSVSVYVRKGMTGTAWFDDVQVSEVPDPPFEGSIVIPGYRGVVAGQKTEPVRIRGWIGDAPGEPLADHRLVAEVLPEGRNRAVVQREISSPQVQHACLTVPIDGLKDGSYRVRLRVFVGSRVVLERSAALVRTRDVPKTRVAFLSDGSAIIDGRPFFPLGVYESISPAKPECKERLRKIAAAGFNCVMNYAINQGATLSQIKGYLDEAHRLGLRIIYSIKDLYPGSQYELKEVAGWKGQEEITRNLVEALRGHPALLAWYVNDELSVAWHPMLEAHYRRVRTLDPDHPEWIALYQVDELDAYTDTTDVMGVDPYPIPDQPISRVAEWTDKAVATGMPVWVIPQIFDWSQYRRDATAAPPTYEEMRNMMWQALTHGANGLICYSYFDIERGKNSEQRWADVTRLAKELNRCAPWFLAGGRAQLTQIGDVSAGLWRRDKRALLAIVNLARHKASISLPFPKGFRSAASLDGSAAPTLGGGVLAVDLDPLEVRLYELE
ncbi:MAG: hypothetical protein ACP5VE_08390 [Chthonomonadales bacterium]